MIDVKLTEKEEKAIFTVIGFLQGLKDCKKEDEEKYLLDNAFASRMILSLGQTDSKDTHMILASSMIQSIIPYLVADKNDSIDKIAEDFDNKTTEMMKDVMEYQKEIMNMSKEVKEN